MCYVGPRDKGQDFLNAILSWDGQPCLLNEVHDKNFLKHQDSVAQMLRAKGGLDPLTTEGGANVGFG
jgi:hypothetical protein